MESETPPTAEGSTDVPLYIGWSEDLNAFGESEKVGGGEKQLDGYGWEDYTDSDLGTPEGSDAEFVSVVGEIRKKKKKRLEDELKYLNELMSKDASASRLGKTRANRKWQVKLREKHVPASRKGNRVGVNIESDTSRYDENVPLNLPSDDNEISDLDDDDDVETEARASEGVRPSQAAGKKKVASKKKAARPSQPTQLSAEDALLRNKKYEATRRRYKTFYTTLNVEEVGQKSVQNDEGFHFGDRGYMSDHAIGGDRGYSDNSSSSEDEVIVLSVDYDARSIGNADIWYNENWEVPYFQIGMKFIDHKQFRGAIQKYSVVRVCWLQQIKNDRRRQTWKCKDGCDWYVHASYDKRTKCFRVKRHYWEHTCRQEQRRTKAGSRYIAGLYRTKIQKDPSYTCRRIMITMFTDRSISVRFSKCVRAKEIVLTELEGNFITEYGVVQGYANYLKSVNPNNTVVVVSEKKTRMPDSPIVFQRMYVCLDVLKDGFKKGCRKVIGIDGTWLKGVCKGVLLVVVAKDGNGQMFPIAWAIVDCESHETWTWFLKLVIKDLELGDGEGVTILSDKHKGILSAVAQLLPKVEHMLCSRHFYGNLRKHFNDAELRSLFWAIAKSYDVKKYEQRMMMLSSKSRIAHDILLTFDLSRWCRAFFSSETTCEDPTNNICETFNGWIKDARCLPVISMCEAISAKIMARRATFFNAALNWPNDIYPYPFARLQRRGKDANHCEVEWDGHNSFNVKDDKYKKGHIVDMHNKTCTCGYWQLTGVPCAHLVRCCLDKGWEPEDYVSRYLKVGMYKKAYERPIECTRGPEMWETYDGPKLEPPVFKRRPGRPVKNRIPSTGEVRRTRGGKFAWLTREGIKMRCTICNKQGHNRRSCHKQPDNTAQTMPTNTATRNNRSAQENTQAAQTFNDFHQFVGETSNAYASANPGSNPTFEDLPQFLGETSNANANSGANQTFEDLPQFVGETFNANAAVTDPQSFGDDAPEFVGEVPTKNSAASQTFRRQLRAQQLRLKKQRRHVAAAQAVVRAAQAKQDGSAPGASNGKRESSGSAPSSGKRNKKTVT